MRRRVPQIPQWFEQMRQFALEPPPVVRQDRLESLSHDLLAFEQRIGELLSLGPRAEELSQGARAWARRFDWDRVAPAFAEAFLEARGAS